MAIEIRRQLDFICIGPGRTGTTALFMALRQHPDIYIPPEKECPIGDTPVDIYMKKYFDGIDGKVIGTITPHYGIHPGCAYIIKSLWPNAKIIALLRNPIERAYSHWKFNARRKLEHASFDESIRRPGNIYKFQSMYGQNLAPYFELFESVHVLFAKELLEKPEVAISALENFLGVKLFMPNNLYGVYNSRDSGKFLDILAKIPGAKFMPMKWKIWARLYLKRGQRSDVVGLDRYFDQDFQNDKTRLEGLIKCQVPW